MRSVALLALLVAMSGTALAQSIPPLQPQGNAADGAQAAPLQTFGTPDPVQCRDDRLNAVLEKHGFRKIAEGLRLEQDAEFGDQLFYRKTERERAPIDAQLRISGRPDVWGDAQGPALRRIIVGQLNQTLGLKDGTQSLFRRRVSEAPVSAVAEVYQPFGGRMGATDVSLIVAPAAGCLVTVRLTLADGVHDPDQEQELVDRLFRDVMRIYIGDGASAIKGPMWRRLVGHGPKVGETATYMPPDMVTPAPLGPSYPGAPSRETEETAPQVPAYTRQPGGQNINPRTGLGSGRGSPKYEVMDDGKAAAPILGERRSEPRIAPIDGGGQAGQTGQAGQGGALGERRSEPRMVPLEDQGATHSGVSLGDRRSEPRMEPVADPAPVPAPASASLGERRSEPRVAPLHNESAAPAAAAPFAPASPPSPAGGSLGERRSEPRVTPVADDAPPSPGVSFGERPAPPQVAPVEPEARALQGASTLGERRSEPRMQSVDPQQPGEAQ